MKQKQNDEESGSDDTDSSKSTERSSLQSDNSESGSTTDSSVSSVASRRSSRTRKRKRHDDSLEIELENKVLTKKAKNNAGKKKKPKKAVEPGVKPNKISELARKVALKDAQRLSALLQQEAKLKNKGLEDKSDMQKSSGPKVVGKFSKDTDPVTTASGKSSSVSQGLGKGNNVETPAKTTSTQPATSTPKPESDELTPRKLKLMNKVAALESQLSKANMKPTESSADISEIFKDDPVNITVIHRSPPVETPPDRSPPVETPPDRPPPAETPPDRPPPAETPPDQMALRSDGFGEFKLTDESPFDEIPGDNKEDGGTGRTTAKKRKKKHSKKSKKRARKSKKSKKSSKKSKKKKKRRKSSSSSSSSSSDDDSSSSSDSSSEEDKKKKRKKKKRRHVRSDHLLYTSESSDVEEIVKGSGIYMKRAGVAALTRSAKTHTGMARGFLVGVFKSSALTDCSLKGNKSKGPLGKTAEARPALFGPGLDAVLEASLREAKEKNMEIVKETSVCHELSTKQSELRGAKKLAAAMLGDN